MNNIEINLKSFLFPKNKKVYHKDFKNGKIIEDTENLCKENEVFVLFENNLPYLKSSHNIYAFSDFTKSDIVEIKDLDFNIDRDRYYGLNIGDFIMYNKEYGFVYDYDDFDNNSVQIKLLNNIIISAVAEWCDITFKFQDLMKKSFEIKLPNNKQLKLIK